MFSLHFLPALLFFSQIIGKFGRKSNCIGRKIFKLSKSLHEQAHDARPPPSSTFSPVPLSDCVSTDDNSSTSTSSNTSESTYTRISLFPSYGSFSVGQDNGIVNLSIWTNIPIESPLFITCVGFDGSTQQFVIVPQAPESLEPSSSRAGIQCLSADEIYDYSKLLVFFAARHNTTIESIKNDKDLREQYLKKLSKHEDDITLDDITLDVMVSAFQDELEGTFRTLKERFNLI